MFDVIKHMRLAPEAVNVFCAKFRKLPVRHRDNHGIINARLWLGDHIDAIFGLRLPGIYPGILNIDLRV